MPRKSCNETASGRVRTRSVGPGWLGAALVVGTLSYPTSPIALAAEPAVSAEEKTQSPPKDSDSTANAFLAALKARDIASAAARFDATVKAALPAEKLAAIWDAQIQKLGELSSWTIVDRAHVEGKDVRIALLKF